MYTQTLYNAAWVILWAALFVLLVKLALQLFAPLDPDSFVYSSRSLIKNSPVDVRTWRKRQNMLSIILFVTSLLGLASFGLYFLIAL